MDANDRGVVGVRVEHEHGRLHGTSRMVLQHAGRLRSRGLEVHALLAACAPHEEVDVLEALRRAGVARATVLETAPCDTGVPVDAMAGWLRDLRPRAVLVPATPASSLLAARLAAAHALPLVADCVGLRPKEPDRLAFSVSTAGGMALVDVEAEGATPIVLMPHREFDDPVSGEEDAPVRVTRLACAPPAQEALETVAVASIAPEDMSLAEASVIVSGGRGLGKAEVFGLLHELAGLLGGHVGASRVATDLGWIEREHLVGMSGSTVRPALYLAIGISGAPHHLMGMREAGSIVALNTDASAPILQLATHGFVGDMHEVVPRVIERLAAMRAAA